MLLAPMRISDLEYSFPEELLAQNPVRPSRVMWVENSEPREISVAELISKIPAGDVLVLNDTKVLHRRVFVGELEILFLASIDQKEWEVLFPSKKMKIGDKIELPLGVIAELTQKGRPQKLRCDCNLAEDYFQKVAELPLPPYIQKARGERHTRPEDEAWYQTRWAEKPGSFAAPTASLHLSENDLEELRKRNVQIEKITLHVGLGTFLPVTTENLNDHKMHEEQVEISASTWQKIQEARSKNRKIWALGTTVTRALESAALGKIPQTSKGFFGSTDLLIQPGFEFQVVDHLMTNFHQPQSTLLALVAAYAGLEKVKACYSWAIERKFRLFSYGDLSVWSR